MQSLDKIFSILALNLTVKTVKNLLKKANVAGQESFYALEGNSTAIVNFNAVCEKA